MSLPPKDAKNEQKPGANSSGGAHLVIGDGLRHFLLCSIIASDSIAYMRHLVQGRRNILRRLGFVPTRLCRKVSSLIQVDFHKSDTNLLKVS